MPADEFADPASRRRWIDEKGMQVFSMLDPDDPLRHVDLFVEYPLPFDDLWRRSDVLDLDGVPVRTALIEDLIGMKLSAGRGSWGPAEHRRRQLRAWASATPGRRFAWLEEMLDLLRRRRTSDDPEGHAATRTNPAGAHRRGEAVPVHLR